MLSTSPRHRLLVVAVIAAAALSGCSKSGEEEPAPAPEATSGQAAAESGPIGLSPDGVTTRIDAPAQSTEEQYAQACMATKDWMATQGGDPDTLVEPYLKEVQAASTPSPVTFNKTWAELDDPQRAAVIIAIRAAADGGC